MRIGEDMWLKESRYGCTEEDMRRFIHGMDGSSPAVRLMLLVERTLYAPRISGTRTSMIRSLDGDSEASRRRIIAVAQGMDACSLYPERDAGMDPARDDHADLARWWILSPRLACSHARTRRLCSREPDMGRRLQGRMMSLLAFAVRNEQWASLLIDTLAGFFGLSGACGRECPVSSPSGDVPGDGLRLVRDGLVPKRCIQALACMICEAFNDGHDQDSMVSPLSVTLSMMVGRCLDAPTAAGLPMVADGMYGPCRTPMDDLKTILGHAARHPFDAVGEADYSTRMFGANMLTIIPEGDFVGDSDDVEDCNVACREARCAVDAAMFALLTHPLFPEHVTAAVEQTDRVFTRLQAERRNNGQLVHYPLLPYATIVRVAQAPPFIVRILSCPLHTSIRMQCDGTDEVHMLMRTCNNVAISADEALSQRRGMVMADRITSTDWSHHDVDAMMRIIRALNPPPYMAAHDPMGILMKHAETPMEDERNTTDFLVACMDSDRMGLASEMMGLIDILYRVDDLIGSYGSNRLDWRLNSWRLNRHKRYITGSSRWSLKTTASSLKAMLERAGQDDSTLPADFVVSDLMAGFSLQPYDEDKTPDPKMSYILIDMNAEVGSDYSCYELVIDWSA